MAPNVIAAAAHIAYDMQPPESLHRTKYQIKAKKNQDPEHTGLGMLASMNVHIPLPNLSSDFSCPGLRLPGVLNQRMLGVTSRWPMCALNWPGKWPNFWHVTSYATSILFLMSQTHRTQFDVIDGIPKMTKLARALSRC